MSVIHLQTILSSTDSDLDFYVALLPEKSLNTRIKTVRSILKSTGKFARLESITKPRVPIVKCTHIASLTNCDFNCSDPFGILNSRIIAHLLKFDPRIHQLAIVVKYWAKIHDCAGQNRISNYALVWMLIFYLQTLPKPIVPTIDEFQRNVPPSMISHYNFAFDYSMPNETENQSQWPELLLGFFKFYRDFDYDSQLICPLYGKTFSKTDVKKKRVVELQRYEQILSTDLTEDPMRLDAKSLCIQDPFDIVRKIPGDISIKKLQQIVRKIGHAAYVVECQLQKGDTKSLLLQIFDVVEFNQYVRQKEMQDDMERMKKFQQLELQSKRLIAEQKRLNAQAPTPVKLENQTSTPPTKKKKSLSTRYMENLSATSVSSQNLRNGEFKFYLKPTFYILHTSQHIVWRTLANNHNIPVDYNSIRKMWAKEITEMIIDILHNIFHLDLYDKASDEFEIKFCLRGERNMLLKEKPKPTRKVPTTERWDKEVLDAAIIFSETSQDIPLHISASIGIEMAYFDCVTIEFVDQLKGEPKNFYPIFCEQFLSHIDYYLRVYFVHRYERAMQSNGSETNLVQQQPSTMLAKFSPSHQG